MLRSLQLAIFATLIALLVMPPQLWGATWFVRTDGGTRYSSFVTSGQCNGSADAAYPGTGTNQNCAFNDVRYLWDTGAGGVNPVWVLSGGDTAVIRVKSGGWRIGWNTATGPGTGNFCNYATSFPYACGMPPPPSGTSGAHTRIIGGCVFDGNCTPVHPVYPFSGNETQVFGGFAALGTLWLTGSSYVDVAGLEITSHNGACSRVGSPNYPTTCSSSSPFSDYSEYGIVINNSTSNIFLTDLYMHGFDSDGIAGQMGGDFTLTRVQSDFNAFAGWNFDDGTAPPTTAHLFQSEVTMIGNGCLEQYPIVNTQFPALACWDTLSAGFGDSWSQGPNSGSQNMDTFTCDHCLIAYNTKDGASGPHTLYKTLSFTNSVEYGNMGQQGKWGMQANSTATFTNDLFAGNCLRMSTALPGAAQNFNISTSLGGSYLSGYCRAAGNLFDFFNDTGSTSLFANNTFVGYNPTFFEFGVISGTSVNTIKNNIFLGYTTSLSYFPNSGQAPGLYSIDPGGTFTISASNDIEFGIRNGDTCGGTIICSDPKLVNEVAQGAAPPPESAFDVLTASSNSGFYLQGTSPAINAGTTGGPSNFSLECGGAGQTSPATIGPCPTSSTPPATQTTIQGVVIYQGTIQ